jgi:hypothetical protein
MAQAVSRRLLTAEARVRSRVSPFGICGGQSGNGTGFSPSTSVFPCQFHSTGAPLKCKSRKNLITFITGWHNKPSRLRCVRSICCGALQLKSKNATRSSKPLESRFEFLCLHHLCIGRSAMLYKCKSLELADPSPKEPRCIPQFGFFLILLSFRR